MPGLDERQAFAAKLGFSETVFVDDPERRSIFGLDVSDVWNVRHKDDAVCMRTSPDAEQQ